MLARKGSGAGGAGGSTGVFEFVTSSTYYQFSRKSSHTFSSVSIGDADSDRWVVVVCTYGDSYNSGRFTGVSIGGSAASLSLTQYDEPEGVVIAYRKVTTGTTADIVLTTVTGVRSWGIAVYRLISTDASPSAGSASAEAGSTAQVTSVPAGSAVVSGAASTANATAPETIGGEATQDVATNIDGSDYIWSYSSNNTTSGTQSIQCSSGARNHAIQVFNFS